jgi:hypothetical protein
MPCPSQNKQTNKKPKKPKNPQRFEKKPNTLAFSFSTILNFATGICLKWLNHPY